MISSKIIFFGNERLSTGFEPTGAPTLQALIHAGYNVVAVVASHQQAISRNKRELEVQQVAKQNNIPVLLPQKPADILDQLASYRADAGVLVAYGRMVPESVINVFPHGIINIHPSLLPMYRGATPIEQAMLDGAQKTGVSLMKLVKAMDAGPLYAQKSIVLSGSEEKFALTNQLLAMGGDLLVKTLPAILDGSLQPAPQDDSQATYCSLLTKTSGVMDLTKTATQLEREVRAYYKWPKSTLELFGQRIIVTKARVAQNNDDDGSKLVVACGNKSYLEIVQLIAPSGRSISGAEFVRGYKK